MAGPIRAGSPPARARASEPPAETFATPLSARAGGARPIAAATAPIDSRATCSRSGALNGELIRSFPGRNNHRIRTAGASSARRTHAGLRSIPPRACDPAAACYHPPDGRADTERLARRHRLSRARGGDAAAPGPHAAVDLLRAAQLLAARLPDRRLPPRGAAHSHLAAAHHAGGGGP